MVGNQFNQELESYIKGVLHADVRVQQPRRLPGLPIFMDHSYFAHDAEVAGNKSVFLVPREELPPAASVAKHLAIVRKAFDAVVVVAAPAIGASARTRLIKQGVPFVVPGNQLYIPELAMDLRDRFRSRKEEPDDRLSPTAQAVLFRHLLHRDVVDRPAAIVAQQLGCSAMSISRAYDSLIACGLVDGRKAGVERYIRFGAGGRELFLGARHLLRDPVRKLRHLQGDLPSHAVKESGETALAALTDLAPPPTRTYALTSTSWKELHAARRGTLREADPEDADFALESWSYDPAGLAGPGPVDLLSLFARFGDHHDARLSIAADTLLDKVNNVLGLHN